MISKMGTGAKIIRRRRMINSYNLTRDEAVEAVTKMIDMIYENRPREFEITISAGVDKIPAIKVDFEGTILNLFPGAKE